MTKNEIIVNKATSSSDSLAESLFQGHLLKVKSRGPELHVTNLDVGMVILLFFAFLLFVWLYTSNRKKLNQVIKSFYTNNYANQLAREDISIGNTLSIVLFTLFVLIVALFITQVIYHYGFLKNKDWLIVFVKIAGILVGTYGLKIFIVQALGFIFQNQKAAKEYSMVVLLFCNMLGLFLFPVVVGLAFAKQISPTLLIYSGFMLFGLFLFIRLFRGIIIGYRSMLISKVYLFLYICALEIAPMIMLAKLIMLKINNLH